MITLKDILGKLFINDLEVITKDSNDDIDTINVAKVESVEIAAKISIEYNAVEDSIDFVFI